MPLPDVSVLRIRWKAAIPAIGIVLGVLSDPSVLAILPAPWAHAIVAISALAAIFTPAVATNRPKSESVTPTPPPVTPANALDPDFPRGE